MRTTFDTFITDNPEQKVLFDREYDDFVRSEERIFKQNESEKQPNSYVVKNKRKYAFA